MWEIVLLSQDLELIKFCGAMRRRRVERKFNSIKLNFKLYRYLINFHAKFKLVSI